jgi:hypothetical protein
VDAHSRLLASGGIDRYRLEGIQIASYLPAALPLGDGLRSVECSGEVESHTPDDRLRASTAGAWSACRRQDRKLECTCSGRPPLAG